MSATEELRILITTTQKGQGAQQTSQGVDKLAKAVEIAATAFAALKSAQVAVDFVKMGASVQRQAGALDNLAQSAGSSGDAITQAIQGASDYTIDRMTAMSAATKAMMLDVAESPDQFERLTKVATQLGRAMGQDAAKSIDDFVVAAGRQSKQIADNLGLMVGAEDANKRYAASLGKTVDELTDAEKKQGFLNEMLRQGEIKLAAMGDETGGLATDFEKVSAALEDAKMGFAELAAETVAGTQGVDAFSENVRSLPDHLRNLDRWMQAAIQGQRTWIKTLSRNEAMEEFQNALKRQAAAMVDWEHTAETARYAHYNLTAEEREEIRVTNEAANAHREAIIAVQQVVATYGSSTESFNQYQAAMASTQAGQDQAYASALQLQAQLELEAAAAQSAAEAQLGLSASLKDATEAQIAQAAIGQLKAALDAGEISFDTYATAVSETQMAFGLADEQSVMLSEGLIALTEQLAAGTVEATAYDDELERLIDKADGTTAAMEEMAQATDTENRKLRALKTKVDSLPAKKKVDIYVTYHTTGRPPSGGSSGDTGNTGQGGESEMSMGRQWPSPAVQPLTSLGNGARRAAVGAAGITIINYINNPDPGAVVREIERYMRLKGHMRWAGLGH